MLCWCRKLWVASLPWCKMAGFCWQNVRDPELFQQRIWSRPWESMFLLWITRGQTYPCNAPAARFMWWISESGEIGVSLLWDQHGDLSFDGNGGCSVKWEMLQFEDPAQSQLLRATWPLLLLMGVENFMNWFGPSATHRTFSKNHLSTTVSET